MLVPRSRRVIARAASVARRAVIAAVLVAGCPLASARDGEREGPDPPKPGSPEAEARRVAAPIVEKREAFRLREQPWLGELTAERGKAVRVQFFRGHVYRLFAAVSKEEAAKGTTVRITVLDAENRIVAEAGGEESAVALELKPSATGLHLVLMRVALGDDAEEADDADREIPVAMIYGYE